MSVRSVITVEWEEYNVDGDIGTGGTKGFKSLPSALNFIWKLRLKQWRRVAPLILRVIK